MPRCHATFTAVYFACGSLVTMASWQNHPKVPSPEPQFYSPGMKNRTKDRFVLGLSATITRKDGHHPSPTGDADSDSEGREAHVDAHDNNATSNKFNPNPNQTVYIGRMTWEGRKDKVQSSWGAVGSLHASTLRPIMRRGTASSVAMTWIHHPSVEVR